ncbi:MAG: ankyrin repeat domain-containing protein [Pseudonocardiaceae bacterium]
MNAQSIDVPTPTGIDPETRLLAAVAASDRVRVEQSVRAGADVNCRDPRSGLTPLMMAAGRAAVDIVHFLIDAGADVFTADSGAGATALHKACQGGSVEVARALVQAGAFVDAVAPTTGHTPLMDALWFKFPDIAKYLLDCAAGLNISTHYGFSLKEHFAYELNVNTIGQERLLRAEQYLKQRQQSDDEQVSTQHLMAAVTSGDLAEVRALLAAGAAVDERFPVVNGFNDAHTPLLVATRDGHREIVATLLTAGADVNATEPTFGAVPLHKAVYNGHVEITRLIAEWPGVDLNFQGATNGYTPLHDALWHGYEVCARILLELGARLDLVGHDGKTPGDLAMEVFGPGHELTEQILRTG